MSVSSVHRKRLCYQRVRGSSLHCCVPQCSCSSRYNAKVSFHSFPADDVARQRWLAKIRRDNFSPSGDTRVCSRHFLPEDLVDTPGGRRWLKKGAIPILFEWNNYSLPEKRPGVWERKPWEESAAARPPVDPSESETVFVSPDHDYCASPTPGLMAEGLRTENEALRQRIEPLQSRAEGLQLRTRFGPERFAGSDDEIRFFTRVDQQSSEGPRSQSAQQHQTQLDSIFMLLEDKIVTFVKEELKKLQKLLGSNRSRRSESQTADEDDSDGEEDEKRSNREAFLKITLHFLRKMKQEELAERLQSMVPADVQELVLIKVEAPEEQKPYVDQQDQEHLHIKEEEEELWTSLGEEQLNVKEETDATSFSFTEAALKQEDDEGKPLFLQFHQHQDEVRDLPTSSSADNLESATGGESCGGAETTRNPDRITHEDDSDSSETEVSDDDEDDSDSSETEVSDDDENDNDVNNPDSQLKHLADSGSKTQDTDKDWDSSPSRVPESGVKHGQKLFWCELCGRSFIHKGNLKTHMRIHTGHKPFCCELCGRRFSQKNNLNTHMRIHTGQKPFCCELCDRRFSHKVDLKKHTRIHTGQKPFCCELCGRNFSQKNNLKTHMKIHSGQKPFCCELCDRRFTEKGNLKTHMRIHTGQKPFCCELCDRRFTRKYSLNKHMRIHTGNKADS